MAECPKCTSEIGSAAFCGCGWKRKATGKEKEKLFTEQTVLCSMCNVSAMEKHKVADQWVNFCLHHADEHRVQQAREYCASKGLTTVSGIKKWLRDQPLAKRIPLREPGQDDEETRVA